MSDENKKPDADDITEKKLEATKKTVTKKKTKAKSVEDTKTEDTKTEDTKSGGTKAEGTKSKVIEKLQAMGVMSGGSSKSEEKSNPDKSEFLKITAASIVAVLLVGSFVWALDKEANNDRADSGINNAPHSNQHAMQSRYPSQWGPSSMNQNQGRYPASQENGGKFFEIQQQRMKQQQEQRQKWIDQQKHAQALYQAQQHKWMEQQRLQQQNNPYQQYPIQQNIPAPQQQWMDQQRAQQKRLQDQQRVQQQKWMKQSYNSYSPQMNRQGQPVAPNYNNAQSYQQPMPYNYYGR